VIPFPSVRRLCGIVRLAKVRALAYEPAAETHVFALPLFACEASKCGADLPALFGSELEGAHGSARVGSISPLKNAVVAFFNLAKRGAKLRTARKITTYVAILSSHPCDDAARRILQRPAILWGMSDAAPKRRWFQFSLRTLFVMVTAAVICAWLGWQVYVVHERKQALRALEPLDVFVTSSSKMKQDILEYYDRHPDHPRKSFSIPFYRRLLGDEAIVEIATFGNYDESELRTLFPEAEVVYNATRGFPGE
jgi:hypothetical protein